MSEMVTAGADLQEFLRPDRPTSDFQLHMDAQQLERNRNYLADAQNAVVRYEIELTSLRARGQEARGICRQLEELAKNHTEHVRDLQKAEAILVKLTSAKIPKETNLANARARVKFFEDAVKASNTPAMQRAEKVRLLMKQLAG
jgi:hypothetical protein